MEQQITLLREQIIPFIPQLIASLIIFIAFWFGSGIGKRLTTSVGKRSNLSEEVRELLEDIVGIGMILLGAVTALGTLGVDVSALVAGLGITGFALGFALQDIVSNTLAGVLILTYRPFRRGNRIKVTSHEGIVVDIDLRYTTLRTDGERILIPNATLFKEAIIVYEPGGQGRQTSITTPGAPTAPGSLPK